MNVIIVGFEKAALDASSEIAARLATLADASVRVSAIELSPFDADMSAAVTEHFTSFGFRGPSIRRTWRGIRKGISLARASSGKAMVSAQDAFVAGVVGYFISRIANVPLEIQEHGDFFSGAWKRESWRNFWFALIGTFILRRAERVRAVSERVKAHLIQIGVRSERIDVIPVSQDLSELLARPLPSTVYGLPSTVFRIIAPCRFVPQKGLDVLLLAAARLKSRGIALTLKLIGTGPLEAKLREQIVHLNIADVVSIEPWRDPARLWDDVDLFVLSSRYEGWGRTIVEAMAAGVPIVTTDVGCVGSFFRPDVDGRAVPSNDPEALARVIEEQLTQHDRREAMQTAARERAREFPSRADLHAKQRSGWSMLLATRYSLLSSPGPRFDLWIALYILFIVATRAASVILFHNSLFVHDDGPFLLTQAFLDGRGYTFGSELGCPSAYKSPAFLFFLTGLYTFFSTDNVWAQAIIQNLFVVGILWLVYLIGARLVGKRAALVAGVLMACYPYTFYHYTQYYHTFLSSFFLLFLVWMLLKLKDTKKYRFAIGSGMGIAGLAYVQGTILPTTPFIALWLALSWRPDWKRAIRLIALMAIVSIGLIAPWTYRNWIRFHAFVPLTTDLGFAMFKANNENSYEIARLGFPQESVDDIVVSSTNPHYVQYHIPKSVEAALIAGGAQLRPSKLWTEWHPKEPTDDTHMPCAVLGPLDEASYDQYWKGKATDWLRENYWTDGWKLQLLKVKTFWQPALFPSVKMGAPWSFADSPLKVWLARMSVTIAASVVIFGGIIGIAAAIRRRDRDVWLPLIILIVYTVMHSIFAGYTKYRMPLDNLMAIYAGWTLVTIWDRVRGKKKL